MYLELVKTGFIIPSNLRLSINGMNECLNKNQIKYLKRILLVFKGFLKNVEQIAEEIDLIEGSYVSKNMPALFANIDSQQIIVLLQNKPDLLLNNLDKFFAEYYRRFSEYKNLKRRQNN